LPGDRAATNSNHSRYGTFSYGDLKLQFVYSCYLVKHGDEYLLWDTGS
jgi:N-acyl homoserine lactone hydrolase